MGVLYKDKGYSSKAIAALERVQRGDPAWVPALRVLAELYGETGRVDRAIASYSLVLKSIPDDSQSLLGLARIHRQHGDRDRSDEYILRLRTRYPGDSRIESEIRKIQTLQRQ